MTTENNLKQFIYISATTGKTITIEAATEEASLEILKTKDHATWKMIAQLRGIIAKATNTDKENLKNLIEEIHDKWTTSTNFIKTYVPGVKSSGLDEETLQEYAEIIKSIKGKGKGGWPYTSLSITQQDGKYVRRDDDWYDDEWYTEKGKTAKGGNIRARLKISDQLMEEIETYFLVYNHIMETLKERIPGFFTEENFESLLERTFVNNIDVLKLVPTKETMNEWRNTSDLEDYEEWENNATLYQEYFSFLQDESSDFFRVINLIFQQILREVFLGDEFIAALAEQYEWDHFIINFISPNLGGFKEQDRNKLLLALANFKSLQGINTAYVQTGIKEYGMYYGGAIEGFQTDGSSWWGKSKVGGAATDIYLKKNPVDSNQEPTLFDSYPILTEILGKSILGTIFDKEYGGSTSLNYGTLKDSFVDYTFSTYLLDEIKTEEATIKLQKALDRFFGQPLGYRDDDLTCGNESLKDLEINNVGGYDILSGQLITEQEVSYRHPLEGYGQLFRRSKDLQIFRKYEHRSTNKTYLVFTIDPINQFRFIEDTFRAHYGVYEWSQFREQGYKVEENDTYKAYGNSWPKVFDFTYGINGNDSPTKYNGEKVAAIKIADSQDELAILIDEDVDATNKLNRINELITEAIPYVELSYNMGLFMEEFINEINLIGQGPRIIAQLDQTIQKWEAQIKELELRKEQINNSNTGELGDTAQIKKKLLLNLGITPEESESDDF